MMKKILLLTLTVAIFLSGCSSGHDGIWETIEDILEITKGQFELIEANGEAIVILSGAIENLSDAIISMSDSMMILLARIEALEKR